MPALGCASLEELRELIGECFRCDLGCTRTKLVFGVGDPNSRVVFIGEAPGRNEDQQGEPFVGAAGQFLNELLEHAGLTRDEVYIANVLKCRPPGNRDPEAFEIEACTPFLREQIRLISPDVLVTLGNFATKFVLRTQTGITRLHGTVQQAGKFRVLPMYHPAAAIYDRTKRDALFEDFAKLGTLLEGGAPSRTVGGESGVEPPAAADPREGDEPLLPNPDECLEHYGPEGRDGGERDGGARDDESQVLAPDGESDDDDAPGGGPEGRDDESDSATPGGAPDDGADTPFGQGKLFS